MSLAQKYLSQIVAAEHYALTDLGLEPGEYQIHVPADMYQLVVERYASQPGSLPTDEAHAYSLVVADHYVSSRQVTTPSVILVTEEIVDAH